VADKTKRPAPDGAGRCSATTHSTVSLSRGAGFGEAQRDPVAQRMRYRNASQLVANIDEYTLFERILTRARGTRLEVSSHEIDLSRPQLAVEKLVHAPKHLFAGVTIQW